jgi:hypothetical protein
VWVLLLFNFGLLSVSSFISTSGDKIQMRIWIIIKIKT